ncbi:MAG TPA: Xaa-Pro aminopeptidase [Candidatus Saccharimonadales bacterium]|nr:Xaa-Pro aminopeptidase [Candidatus Saccharimonadales bacterium]
MKSHFSEEFFKNNRAGLRKLFAGTAPIVITANGLLQRSGDTTFSFRQDSNFWYLTGINQPDFVLVMDKNEEYLIAPPRSRSQNVMEGQLGLAPLAKMAGISKILDNNEGWKKLDSRLKKVKHAATIAALPEYIEHHGFYVNPARQNLTEKLKSSNPEIKLLDLKPHLIRLRVIKQPAELDVISEAIAITAKAFRKVKTKLTKYKHEFEVEAELGGEFRRLGASGHAFSPIVASDLNATTIHYTDNNEPLKNKNFILIDGGAEVENYVADISRTYFIKTPTKRQKAVYTAVKEVQEYAINLLGPGVILKNYEKLVEAYMGEKLRELGLIKTISSENVRKFFPHGTTHFLGLDAHDSGDYERPLEPGMVLTVEPGIYIPKEKIGIRIEDDFLVTEDGLKNLSQKVPYA